MSTVNLTLDTAAYTRLISVLLDEIKNLKLQADNRRVEAAMYDDRVLSEMQRANELSEENEFLRKELATWKHYAEERRLLVEKFKSGYIDEERLRVINELRDRAYAAEAEIVELRVVLQYAEAELMNTFKENIRLLQRITSR